MRTIRNHLILAGLLLALAGDAWGQPAIQFAAATYTVAENAGTITLTVLRLNDLSLPVGVDYATADGTATNGARYTGMAGTLSFSPGETNKDIVVPILNDGVIDITRAFLVKLSNPSGGAVLGSASTATVRITDNDKALSFEFANYWAREDEGSVLIGVLRGDDGNFPLSVTYATKDGTAIAGQDFTATSGTLTFAAGERVRLVTVPILNNGVKNGGRAFTLGLSNPANASVAARTTVTLSDNDPGVRFVENQPRVQEQAGSIVLLVERGNDQLLDAFTVDYRTTNGTAKAGSDYIETKGTLTFAAGEMTKSFAVPILDDGFPKRDRQFSVLLSNASGGMALVTEPNVTAKVTVCDTREMLPHRFDAVQIMPDKTVSLKLGGGFTPGLGLSNRFQPYFDVVPIETSTNLIDWSPLVWLIRTNSATNPLSLHDTEAVNSKHRYYRTPSTNFVTPLRAPTGPYRVGFIDRTIQDDSRRNRYRISTNGSFPITIWYPAQPVSGQWPADPYEPEPFLRDPRAGAWEDFVDRAPSYRRYAIRNAPFAEGLAGLPIVFWSSGYLWARYSGQEWAEHLASHGYVVVGVDHLDSCAVIYPDGRYLYTVYTDTVGRDVSVALMLDRVRDCVVVLDEMTRWNQNDPLFAGRLGVQNAAAMGWSLGAEVAVELCRADARFKAAVPMEGYYQTINSLLAAGLPKPVLSMYQAETSDSTLFNRLKRDAIWFQLQNTEHDSFNTYYWQATTFSTLPRAREAARSIIDYTVWFLNKHLKGNAAPMPNPASYPQVFNFKEK